MKDLIQKRFFKAIYVLGVGFIITTISVNSYAGGFQLFEASVKSLGNAFAGTSAIAQDASTEFYNPAGLTRLKHPQISFSSTVVDINTKGTLSATTQSTGSSVVPPLNGEFPVTGDGQVHPGGLDLVPSFHAAYPINDRFVLGFGVDVPYGLETDYSSNSVARFLATESKLTVVSIGPSLGVQITKQLSVGFGVGAEYMDATLNQDAPTTYFIIPPTVNVQQQASFDNEADGWAFVWDVGALYQFTPKTRLGIAYHAEAHQHLKGDASLKGGLGFPAVTHFDTKGSVSSDITLPDSLNVSLYHKINPEFAVMTGLTWTDWSELNSVTLNYSGAIANSPTSPVILQSATINLDFRNTYRVSLGGDFMPNEHWTFRTGLAWDESPVRGSTSRTIRLPDSNRFWIAFGASYKFNKNWEADLGYSHLFITNAKVNRTQHYNIMSAGEPTLLTERAMGDFSSSVNEFGFEVDYKFA